MKSQKLSKKILLLSPFTAFVAAVTLAVGSFTNIHAQDEVSEKNLAEYTKYLSSPELEGRGTGSQGNKKAAEYIAQKFKEFGLKPAVSGSYFQEFDVATGAQLGSKNSCMFNILVIPPGVPKEMARPQKRAWTISNDFLPLSGSPNSSITGGLVFAGFGISSKELNYDDYDQIDVKGKVVIVIRGNPEQKINPRENFNDKSDIHSRFASVQSIRAKAMTAKEKGAIGMIVVTPLGDSSDVLLPVKLERNARLPIPVIHVKRSVIGKLLPPEKSVLRNEEKIRQTQKPMSYEVEDISLTLTTDIQESYSKSQNVIGFIPGTDPSMSGEYIVCGAHYDHLGYGEEGSLYAGKDKKAHLGADDNASGTAGMIELARRISQKPLSRTVVFMGFSGEELGLLGSAHYVKNPMYPLENTAFMLNLDMIGRLKENKLNVQGTGTAAGFTSLVDSLAQPFSLIISKTADGFGPSDHSSFYGKNIPVLFLFSGLHEDYHRPSDVFEKINIKGQNTITNYGESLLRTIGNSPTKPQFERVKSAEPSRSMAFKVYVGTIPDYSDHPKGMRITGVREGSPAEKAGMEAGDVIIKFGDTDVKNAYDYTYSLGKYKAGDKVKVEVLRGPKEDKKFVLELTLSERK